MMDLHYMMFFSHVCMFHTLLGENSKRECVGLSVCAAVGSQVSGLKRIHYCVDRWFVLHCTSESQQPELSWAPLSHFHSFCRYLCLSCSVSTKATLAWVTFPKTTDHWLENGLHWNNSFRSLSKFNIPLFPLLSLSLTLLSIRLKGLSLLGANYKYSIRQTALV